MHPWLHQSIFCVKWFLCGPQPVANTISESYFVVCNELFNLYPGGVQLSWKYEQM